jgi:hypothetical protein
MTNAQRLAAAGLFLVAVIAGVLVASLALGAIGGSGEATPTTAAGGPTGSPPAPSPSASAAPASPSPSAPASASPSEPASVEPSTEPTLTPTASTAQPATITITQLKLDATENPDGLNRRVKFRAEGPGTIGVQLTAVSPRGEAIVCLRSTTGVLGCTTTADGSLSAQITDPVGDYTLTLRGDGIAEPIVDATLTFPATEPAVTIANARFDGTEFPDTNGIGVIVTPRSNGQLGLLAKWGGHPFLYEIDLMEQGGPGGGTLADQGPATLVNTSFDVTAPNPWKLVVQNTETGFGPTGMTVSLTWP